MPPILSVVIATLNRATDLQRCLQALQRQTIASHIEVIVIDDGSSDFTSEVARRAGAVVIRNPSTRGVSAARNSGIKSATADIIAFLDDDCEPYPDWAERLTLSYDEEVVGLGGPILTAAEAGVILGYLSRNNPLRPQEIELAASTNIFYRFALYLKRQLTLEERHDSRQVYAMASANLSVRRQALMDVGGFDERIRFGSEDYDLCWRLKRAFPTMSLIFEPSVRVTHHFRPSLRDLARRSCAYGRGSALMHRKWPDSVPPTFLPFPLCMLVTLLLSFRFPLILVSTALLPHLFYPRGLRYVVVRRKLSPLLDAYLQLAQEVCDNYGFIAGIWTFRSFTPEASVRKAFDEGNPVSDSQGKPLFGLARIELPDGERSESDELDEVDRPYAAARPRAASALGLSMRAA